MDDRALLRDPEGYGAAETAAALDCFEWGGFGAAANVQQQRDLRNLPA